MFGKVTVNVSSVTSPSSSAICASYSKSRIVILPSGRLLSHSMWYFFCSFPKILKFVSVMRSLPASSCWSIKCSLGKNWISSSPVYVSPNISLITGIISFRQSFKIVRNAPSYILPICISFPVCVIIIPFYNLNCNNPVRPSAGLTPAKTADSPTSANPAESPSHSETIPPFVPLPRGTN